MTPPAARRATSYDVARLAGVAQSTVSRCFQPGSTISPATRALVTDAAQRLGYTPNAIARSLITRRSHLVGVVATRYTLRGNPDVAYALGDMLARAGKQVLLITADSDDVTTADLRGALEYPLAGLISCVTLAEEALRAVQRRGIPLVLFNRTSRSVAVDGVTTNHAAAAAAMAMALHQAGHRRFLCVSGPEDAPVSWQRCEGFVARLAELGLPGTPVVPTDYSYAGGRRGFLDHAARNERPGVVFCANDQIAMGVMDACRYDLHLTIPGDISVVGFDDVAEAARPGYRLTTVHQDSVGMAGEAVAILLARLADPGGAVINRVVQAVLVPRASAKLAP